MDYTPPERQQGYAIIRSVPYAMNDKQGHDVVDYRCPFCNNDGRVAVTTAYPPPFPCPSCGQYLRL
jgi:rubrerythrin